MAKKKTAKPKEPTQAQLDALAKFLRERGGNVFRVCLGYNIDSALGDRLFDLLHEKTNTFKCENCDVWMDVSHQSDASVFGLCDSCIDEIDGAEADDD